MEAELKFVIPALLGVESLVAREVKKLGLAEVRAENGRVLCSGGLGDIPRLNLNLRVGARVLLCRRGVADRVVHQCASAQLAPIFASTSSGTR